MLAGRSEWRGRHPTVTGTPRLDAVCAPSIGSSRMQPTPRTVRIAAATADVASLARSWAIVHVHRPARAGPVRRAHRGLQRAPGQHPARVRGEGDSGAKSAGVRGSPGARSLAGRVAGSWARFRTTGRGPRRPRAPRWATRAPFDPRARSAGAGPTHGLCGGTVARRGEAGRGGIITGCGGIVTAADRVPQAGRIGERGRGRGRGRGRVRAARSGTGAPPRPGVCPGAQPCARTGRT